MDLIQQTLCSFASYTLILDAFNLICKFRINCYFENMKLPRAHHLSAEILAGQVLMPRLNLAFINRNSVKARRMLQLIRRFHVGGFLLAGGHPADVRYWTIALQRESQFPLFFGADLEKGLGATFSNGTLFPHALAFGAADDLQLARDFGEMTAKEARSVGINLCFAPVLNVANAPGNPVANLRAFHSQPEKVAEMALAFIESVQNVGVACVGKYFPGPGTTDSDLFPVAAVKSDTKGLLLGHFEEKALVQNIIREQWQYRGVLFSDALDLRANQSQSQLGKQVVSPLQTGADVLLAPADLPLAHRRLVEQIDADSAFRKSVEAAVERIFSLKKWLHKYKPAQDHPFRVNKIVEHPNHFGAAMKVAERAVTLLHKSKRFPLSLENVQRVYHLVFTDDNGSESPLVHFTNALRDSFKKVNMLVNPTAKKMQSQQLSPGDLMVISLHFHTRAEHHQKLDWQKLTDALQLLKTTGVVHIIVLFGNPFQLRLLPANGADALFLTYSDVPASQLAAFRAICGEIEAQGKPPVMMP